MGRDFSLLPFLECSFFSGHSLRITVTEDFNHFLFGPWWSKHVFRFESSVNAFIFTLILAAPNIFVTIYFHLDPKLRASQGLGLNPKHLKVSERVHAAFSRRVASPIAFNARKWQKKQPDAISLRVIVIKSWGKYRTSMYRTVIDRHTAQTYERVGVKITRSNVLTRSTTHFTQIWMITGSPGCKLLLLPPPTAVTGLLNRYRIILIDKLHCICRDLSMESFNNDSLSIWQSIHGWNRSIPMLSCWLMAPISSARLLVESESRIAAFGENSWPCRRIWIFERLIKWKLKGLVWFSQDGSKILEAGTLKF